jgi:hypothetical protein
VVSVRNDVGDVERGAEVSRDARAQVEVDRCISGGEGLGRGPLLLDENAKDPSVLLGSELDIDELRSMGQGNGLDNAHKRVAVDSLKCRA